MGEDKQGKKMTQGTRLILAAIALCHSPMFVLDQVMDLTEFKFPRDLSLARIINVSVLLIFINARSTLIRSLAIGYL